MTAVRPHPRHEVTEARLTAGLDPARPALDLAAHAGVHGRLPARRSKGADTQLTDAIVASRLLGRGGGAFPAGHKLRTVAAGRRPVVVCNAAEGEPGSRKDRLLLTRTPHLVLDGIEVATRAVGAGEAHLVVHRGSPALTGLRRALAERDAPVALHELPARYVASEETALVAFLNGRDARPVFTPPRPYAKGVGGRPTLVSNAETLAHLALIARHGADWFRTAGIPDDPGTRLVTVSGSPQLPPAVLEVHSGAALPAVLEAAGSGLAGQQAVLVGGYFGAWLTVAAARRVRLSVADLRAAGGALGAGIIVGLPYERCGLAETARVLGYLAQESAQQCGPCLNGLPVFAAAFTALAHGVATDAQLAGLSRWASVIPGRGACRHPDGAIRLAVSALGVFAADAAEHAAGRPCPGAQHPGWLPLPATQPSGWR